MSELQNKIQKVLSERAKNSVKIISQFKNAHALIEDIDNLVSQIKVANIEEYEQFVPELENKKNNLEETLKKYTFLEKRVKRTDKIYIGLAGSSQCGKSTLIQTLTNLPKDIIPSADEGSAHPTTAVHSEIFNHKNSEAVIYFYTEQEFKDSLAKLLELLGKSELAYNIDKFLDFDFNSLNVSASMNNNIQKIKRIQESYIYYKDKLKGGTETLTENRFSEGIYYFTYMDNDETHRFFPAVKEAKIYAPFNGIASDASVALLDLPGFDESGYVTDTTLNKLKDVDFLFFIENPTIGKSSFQEPFWKSYENIQGRSLLQTTFHNFLSVFINKFIKNTDDNRCNDAIATFKEKSKLQHDVYMAPVKLEDGSHNTSDVADIFGKAADKLAETLAEMDGELNHNLQKEFDVEGLEKLISQLGGNNPEEFDNSDILLNKNAKAVRDLEKNSKKKILADLDKFSLSISKELLPKDENNNPKPGPLTTNLIDVLSQWMHKESNAKEANLDDYNTFDISKYEIDNAILTQYEEKAHNKYGLQANLQRIEDLMRTDKNYQIKTDFSELVVKLAANKHNEYFEKLVGFFLNGLGIDETNSEKEKIKERISDFLTKICGVDFNGYFKSLVDRFSDDAIGLLVGKPFTNERKLFFNEKKKNFYILASVDDGIDDTEPISEQPLYFLILRHEDKYIKESKWQPALNLIKRYLPTIAEVAVKPLIKKFIPYGDCPAVEIVIDECLKSMMTDEKSDDDKLKTLQNRLEREKPTATAKNNDFVYTNVETPEEIMTILNEDIKILNYVLIHSVINAIDLETPFGAFETNFIEDIKKEFDDDGGFADFVNNNYSRINADSVNKIKREMEQMRLLNEAVANTKKHLSNIKSNTWEE
jgi:hypothetical protein